MNQFSKNIIAAIEKVVRMAPENTQTRQTAVRWFNRLYYELSKWNKEFVELLWTYPGFRSDASEKEYLDFRMELWKRIERLDDREYHNSHRLLIDGLQDPPSNEFCLRLEFLAERIPQDFSWLKDQGTGAYEEFLELVGLARVGPFRFINLAHHLRHDLDSFVKKIKYGRYTPELRIKLKNNEIAQLFKTYQEQSAKQLEIIRVAAWKVGVKLLSVTEYEESLKREGSLNPSLIVIGEVAMSQNTYNVGQAGAVGPNAHAHDMTFNQIWNQLQGVIDLSRLAIELSNLRQEMKKEAVEPEQDIAVSEIAKAEQLAKIADGPKTLEHLKSAGKWALDIATKIGTSLAVEAIKRSIDG
jgi:hypothetical protein